MNQTPALKYSVVVHDFHGFWTHHPHRALRAFFLAWKEITGERLPPELVMQILNRPPEQPVRKRAIELAFTQGKDKTIAKQIEKLLNKLYGSIYIPNMGLKRTVKTLSKMGVKQVVLTNGELRQVRPVIEEWGLLNFLVHYGGLVGLFGQENTPKPIKPKPHINIPKMILSPLGIELFDPHQCLLVGDWYGDVNTAKNNGMHSAMLITGTKQEIPEFFWQQRLYPNHIILQPQELIPIVQGIDLDPNRERLKLLRNGGIQTQTTKIWD